MYQILGLRDYVDKSGKVKKRHAFQEKNWRFTSVEQVFQNSEEILTVIPQDMQWNLYWTVADCFEQGEVRKLKEQWVIPFDIDELAFDKDYAPHGLEICTFANLVLRTACTAIGVDHTKVGAIWSGNGLQFFVKITKPILSDDYFESMREQYKLVCDKIQSAMALNHIPGKVDHSVFSPARLMRLPSTENRKPSGAKRAFVLQSNIEAQEFNLDEVTGDALVKKADTINKEVWKQRNYKPDQEGVLSGCEYLKWCKEKPDDVDESQWYALLGILSFLPQGQELSHQYSEGYKGYDASETQEKFEQAQRASGPRTCKDIGTRWDGCQGCHHYNQVTAPIMIQGPNHIPTKETGFRITAISDTGKPVAKGVSYEDLIKYFLTIYEYIKVNKNGMYVYSTELKKWIPFSEDEARSWARIQVVHKPSKSEMAEFLARLQAENLKPKDWLDRGDDSHINFNNGVLDRNTGELKPHSSEYGFKYVLPFDYNPHATAPRFDKFLEEIFDDNKGLVQLAKEFGGYCLSGDEYWEHKSLLLIGDGENGKSVFMDILKAVCGKDNACSLPMRALNNRESRYSLVNKLINCSEETSVDAFLRSDVFKTLSSGGEVEVRHFYEQPFDYRNKAKLIISCNEMPPTKDLTHGMFRRLLIVPFNRTFSKDERDPFLREKLIQEASGIYNTLLNSYKDMKKRQHFIEVDATKSLLTQYKYDNDPVAQFLDDCIIEAQEDKEVVNSELYRIYSEYCANNGYRDRILTNIGFSMKMSKLSNGKYKAHLSRRDGKVVKVVKGISLNQVF